MNFMDKYRYLLILLIVFIWFGFIVTISMCAKYVLILLILFTWYSFIVIISVSVLARIISRSLYIMLAINIYFLTYIYYAACNNYCATKEELLDSFIKTLKFLYYNLDNIKNYFVETIIKVIKYLFDNPFIISTLILILIYIDAYYYAENKLALILLNQVKGRDYTWWKPYYWWEL